jgi:hypothetical protein
MREVPHSYLGTETRRPGDLFIFIMTWVYLVICVHLCVALSPGPKRPGREADHSPLSDAEVKNGGDIPPLPHYVLRAW